MAYNTNALTALDNNFLAGANATSGGGTSAPRVWLYNSQDSEATVKGANYFSDGQKKGMQVGDLVIVFLTSTPAIYLLGVSAVSASGATVTAQVVIT